MAGITPLDVDLIILATSTSDDLFGSASHIQAQLGAINAVAFDLTAACSGFIFGLVTAAQYIRTGVYQNVVL
ncbi:3-oxoacyl-ACP synthase, partial [Escherichia coli]|nr:3-oxoacyl-ACP synthase [Escherichia coli]